MYTGRGFVVPRGDQGNGGIQCRGRNRGRGDPDPCYHHQTGQLEWPRVYAIQCYGLPMVLCTQVASLVGGALVGYPSANTTTVEMTDVAADGSQSESVSRQSLSPPSYSSSETAPNATSNGQQQSWVPSISSILPASYWTGAGSTTPAGSVSTDPSIPENTDSIEFGSGSLKDILSLAQRVDELEDAVATMQAERDKALAQLTISRVHGEALQSDKENAVKAQVISYADSG